MKEIIFFDVDDTLVDSRTHTIPQSTIDALQKLHKTYYLAIATGRSLSSMKESGVHLIIDWDMYVCNNGQMVYDGKENIIVKHAIDIQAVQQVLRIAEERKEPVLLSMPQWKMIGEVNAYMEHAHHFFNVSIPDAITYHEQEVIMMLIYGPKGWDYAPYQGIDGITLVPGQSTYCDIVKEGFDKAKGIQSVMNYLHCTSYLAFGDSNNDLGMLKDARIAIVMGQGTNEAKAYADYITKAVDEDGIAYAVEQLHL